MIFKERLTTVEFNLENGNTVSAFKEIQSIFDTIFDEIKKPRVNEVEVKKICEALNRLADVGYEYQELIFYYKQVIPLLLSICKPQVLRNVFLRMAQTHYTLGLLDNTIFLATKAYHYDAMTQLPEETKVRNYLIWLEQALEFEALKKYYESLVEPSTISGSFRTYNVFFIFVKNRFIQLLKNPRSQDNNWKDFYQKNYSFLKIVARFEKDKILNCFSNYRLKKAGASLELEKMLFETLKLLKAFLKLESILQESKKLKELDFAWDLRRYLEMQLKGLPLPTSCLEKFETKMNLLQNNFEKQGYWINTIKSDKNPETTMWVTNQSKLKEIRATFWSQPVEHLFIATENYHHKILNLFKSGLATERTDDLNNNNNQPISASSHVVTFKPILVHIKIPCEWQLCVKGSYARGDIHVYSDVDVFLLIEKNEFQLHHYFQLLITHFHHFLLGMGDDWEWTGHDITRDMIESCGLSIDSGDREHLLMDYPTIETSTFTQKQKEDYLKKKLRFISTPQELARWVVAKVTQDDIDEEYLTAFSLLQGEELLHSPHGQSLFKLYHDLLQETLTEKQIKSIGELRLINGLKETEFRKLKPEQSSTRLKNYLQLLNLVMICIYYCHKQTLRLPTFSFEAWQQGLSGYWCSGFLQAWLKAWQTIHTWRFLYQQKQQFNNENNNNYQIGTVTKTASNIVISNLTLEQQKELNVIYQTLLVPFFTTLSTRPSCVSNPWQCYAEVWSKDTIPLNNFLQILCTAREAGVGVKLNRSQIQPIWEVVAKELMTTWSHNEHTIQAVKQLDECKTAWNDLLWGQVVREVIHAGADPDNLVGWEIILQSVNPTLAFFLIACGAGRDPALAPRLLACCKKWALSPDPTVQAALQQVKQTLSYFHPDIAWLLAKESIFQLNASEGFSEERGQMKGVDTGMVYLKMDYLKEVLAPRSGLFALFSSAPTWKKSNTFGNRIVSCIRVNQQHFFLKWYPEAPDREESVLRLTYRLFGRGVAKGELFAYRDAHDQIHPVWVSQGVQGYNAQDVLNAFSNDPKVREKSHIPLEETPKLTGAFDKIDGASFSIQFLITTLFCQEDGKPDNLILQPIEQNGVLIAYELISIDNDHAYFEPVIVEENGSTKLQLKSLVYCLNQMKRPLDARILERFLSFESYDLLQRWLEELRERETGFQALFKENVKAHQQSRLTFHFPSQSIPKLWERWEKLRKILTDNAQLSAIEVLCRVIPRAGWQYRMALEKSDDIGLRFAHISQGQYTTTQIGNTVVQHHTCTRVLPLPSSALRVQAATKITTPAVSQIEKVKQELQWACKLAEPFIMGVIAALQEKKIAEFLQLFPVLILENYKSRVLATMDWGVLNPEQQTQILTLFMQQAISFEHLTFKHCASLTETQLERLLRYSPGLQSLYLKDTSLISGKLCNMLSRYNETITTLEIHGLIKLTTFSEVTHFPTLTRVVLKNIPCREWLIRAPYLKVLLIKNCAQLIRIQTGSQNLDSIKVTQCPMLKQEGVFGIIETATKFKQMIWPETLHWSEPNLIQSYPWLLTYSWDDVQPYLRLLKEIPLPNTQGFIITQPEKLYSLQQNLITTMATWLREHASLQQEIRLPLQEQLTKHWMALFSNNYSNIDSILAALTIFVFELEKAENVKAVILTNWLDRDVNERNSIALKIEVILPLFLKATACSDWKVRKRAIIALGKIIQALPKKVSGILPKLVERIRDEDGDVRQVAITVVNEVLVVAPEKVNGILSLLLYKVMVDAIIEVRQKAANAVSGMLKIAPETVTKILPQYLQAINDEVADVRQVAVTVLSGMVQAVPKRAAQILPQLVKAMDDKERSVRKSAVLALSKVLQTVPGKTSEIFPSLLNAMNDRDEKVRQEVVIALGGMVAIEQLREKILLVLLNAMNDYHNSVREAVVKVLSDMCQVRSEKIIEILPPLLKALEQSKSHVRKGAVKILGEMVQTAPEYLREILPSLLTAMDDGVAEVRAEAVSTLGSIVQMVPEIVNKLFHSFGEAMNDRDWQVRREAVKALGYVAQTLPEKVNEILTLLLKTMEDGNVNVQQMTVTMLGVIVKAIPEKMDEVLPILLKSMKSSSRGMREEACKALSKIAQRTLDKVGIFFINFLLQLYLENFNVQIRMNVITRMIETLIHPPYILPQHVELWPALRSSDSILARDIAYILMSCTAIYTKANLDQQYSEILQSDSNVSTATENNPLLSSSSNSLLPSFEDVDTNTAINTAPVPGPRLSFFGNSIEISKEEAKDNANIGAENSSITEEQDTLPTLTITQERDDDVPELIDAEELSEQESYRMR